MKTFHIMALSLLLASAATAKDQAEPVVAAQDAAAFDIQAAGVRAQLAQGGRYEFVRTDERATLERRMAEMHDLLAAHGPVPGMNDSQRVQLFNAQEEVNAILNRRDGTRLICQRRAPTGSHVKANTCVTYAEQERIRSATQRHMLDHERRGNASPAIETRATALGRD